MIGIHLVQAIFIDYKFPVTETVIVFPYCKDGDDMSIIILIQPDN